MIALTHTTHSPGEALLKQSQAGLRKLLARSDLGFFHLPYRPKPWDQCMAYAEDLKQHANKLIVLGMGGSSLGGQTLIDSLARNKHSVEIWDDIDALTFWTRIQNIEDLEKTHWLIISKSGGTIETLTMASFINQKYCERQLGFSRHATIISEPAHNALTVWAKKEKVPLIEFPIDVGGRFSVLTPVGLLPAAFAGIDIGHLRDGALWALGESELLEQLIAQTLWSFQQEKWISTFWFYCDRLSTYGAWLKQLWAESLAKEKSMDGGPAPRVSTPMVCVGTRDQHSVLQQIADGYKDKFVWFFRSRDSENFGPKLIEPLFDGQDVMKDRKLGELLSTEAEATQKALEAKGVPSLTLCSQTLGAKELGAYFMLLELVVGAVGESLNLNAFDQPGVELGKKLTKEALWK